MHMHVHTKVRSCALDSMFPPMCNGDKYQSNNNQRPKHTSEHIRNKEQKSRKSEEEKRYTTPSLKRVSTFRLSYYQFYSKYSPAQLQTINDYSEFRVVAGACRSSSNRLMVSYIS
ncbi:hypothetical protein ATANTOWER_020088 [Ataeniobius toweri]|uniref:Uncharacterized protein n=1 Tax=Ataeniobius toweri TaxID=208326 RepID=A0ABU7BJL9_9TELE|nr:hypothetical protein [Ataeniobius toweri]